jgi:F-type H+-transporting ATPase subunit delta
MEKRAVEQVRGELDAFAEIVAASADLRNLLASPAVPRQSQHAVIAKLVERLGAGATLRNFLFVLVDNRRASLVGEIQKAFEATIHARLGIAEAEVTSAQELSEAQREELLAALQRKTGGRVEARFGVDPELIGGARVRLGSTVYDGTIRGKLDRLRATLAAE